MFHKLRWRLTFINVGIIALLFGILITGAYFFSQAEITKRSEMLLQRIAEDVNAGILKDIPRPGEHGVPPLPHHSVFFVKTDSTGRIASVSSSPSISSAGLVKLTQETLLAANDFGQVHVDQVPYNFFKTSRAELPGSLIVFQNIERERDFSRIIITGLLLAGLICLALSMVGSFFLADRAMRPIQASWQQQREFLADASHELRTPLAVIQANMEVVMSNPDESVSDQDKWLKNIKEGITSMTYLVDSLLFLARTDSEQHLLERKTFDLNNSLMEVMLSFKLLSDNKRILLEAHLDDKVTYCGDESKIKQVVGILLDNAVRHTSKDGMIKLCLQKKDSKILVVVSDTGEGIDGKHLGRIFDRFYQADPSRSKGGAGLGLSIAKWIIEQHGGSFQVMSTVGEGTTFIIVLPLA